MHLVENPCAWPLVNHGEHVWFDDEVQENLLHCFFLSEPSACDICFEQPYPHPKSFDFDFEFRVNSFSLYVEVHIVSS